MRPIHILLIFMTIFSFIACNDTLSAGEKFEERLYGEWATLDTARDIRTEIIFREDKSYESTIFADSEIRENGTWSVEGNTLNRLPQKCYSGPEVTTCSNRNPGEIEFVTEGFLLKIRKIDFELGIDSLFVQTYTPN